MCSTQAVVRKTSAGLQPESQGLTSGVMGHWFTSGLCGPDLLGQAMDAPYLEEQDFSLSLYNLFYLDPQIFE